MNIFRSRTKKNDRRCFVVTLSKPLENLHGPVMFWRGQRSGICGKRLSSKLLREWELIWADDLEDETARTILDVGFACSHVSEITTRKETVRVVYDGPENKNEVEGLFVPRFGQIRRSSWHKQHQGGSALPKSTDLRYASDDTRPYDLDHVPGLEKLQCFYTFMSDDKMGHPQESGHELICIDDLPLAVSWFITRLLGIKEIRKISIGPRGFVVTALPWVWHLIEPKIILERDVLYSQLNR